MAYEAKIEHTEQGWLVVSQGDTKLHIGKLTPEKTISVALEIDGNHKYMFMSTLAWEDIYIHLKKQLGK